MAPTEILAEQHFRKFQSWMEPLGLKVSFLVGSQSKKIRKVELESIETGKTHIAVGTHALIQEEVKFKNLGLVVIDEQHRFGVVQRSTLRKKGQNPEILTMTATPIPRTLALTLWGDLDLSIIKSMPPGRKPVITKVAGAENRVKAYAFINKKISEGRQAFVICPLVDPSDNTVRKSVKEEYERLSKTFFRNVPIAMLHGKMKAVEKEKIMRGFEENKI